MRQRQCLRLRLRLRQRLLLQVHRHATCPPICNLAPAVLPIAQQLPLLQLVPSTKPLQGQ